MANIIKNILNGLNLGEDEEDFDDDGYDWDDKPAKRIKRVVEEVDDDPDEEDDEPPKKKVFNSKKDSIDDDDDDSFDDDEPELKSVKQPNNKKNYGKVVHMKSIQGGAGSKMELRVIRPKTYEDSREICDTLSGAMPVVLNLEGLNADLAQRILDFTSGSVYAMNGNLQKVTNYIFVITPTNVEISGNFDEMLDGSVDLTGSSKYVFKNQS